MPEHDPARARAGRPGGHDVVQRLESQELAPRESRDRCPSRQSDHHHHIDDIRLQPDHHRQDEKEVREAHHDLDQTRNGCVDPSPCVAGHAADNHADHRGDAHRHQSNLHRHHRAVNHPRGQVSPDVVRAQPMLRRRPTQSDRTGLQRTVWNHRPNNRAFVRKRITHIEAR